MKSRIFAAVGTLALSIAAAPGAGQAATFSDSLLETGLNPNLSVGQTPGYDYATPGDGLVLSHGDGLPNGVVGANSVFTFSGAFTLSVDVAGLTTGLSDLGEAGLVVSAGSSFSDVFGFNNTRNFGNNGLGMLLSDVPIGPDLDLLTISGNSGSTPFVLGMFLLQEFNGTVANQVTFTNLNLVADTITGVAQTGVPEPAAWALMIAGFGLAGAALRRRRSLISV
jgi:hypothetical protein